MSSTADIDYPPNPNLSSNVNVAAIAFCIIFSIYAFSQVLLIGIPALLRNRHARATDSLSESAPKLEPHQLSPRRCIFCALMVLVLLALTLSYSLRVAAFAYGYDEIIPVWYTMSLLVKEMTIVLLYSALLLLGSCQTKSVPISWPAMESTLDLDGSALPGKEMRTFLILFLLIMFASITTRMVLVGIGQGRNVPGMLVAIFTLHQIYILTFLIFTVCFVWSAIGGCKRRDHPSTRTLNGHTYNDDILYRIARHVSPALGILAAYEVAWDILFSVSASHHWGADVSSVLTEGLALLWITTAAMRIGLMPKNVTYSKSFIYFLVDK